MSWLWQVIRHPRLIIRLRAIVAVALLCLLGLGGLAVNEQSNAMWDARTDKLRAIADQAVSIAADLDRRVQAGGLTRAQAAQQFADTIRPIRYDDGARLSVRLRHGRRSSHARADAGGRGHQSDRGH